jgi:hypothetical protein
MIYNAKIKKNLSWPEGLDHSFQHMTEGRLKIGLHTCIFIFK